MNVDTQTAQILAYLLNGHSISQLQAYFLFGCTRLSARIFDLRKLGFNVESNMFYDKSTKKHYSIYKLKSAENKLVNQHPSIL